MGTSGSQGVPANSRRQTSGFPDWRSYFVEVRCSTVELAARRRAYGTSGPRSSRSVARRRRSRCFAGAAAREIVARRWRPAQRTPRERSRRPRGSGGSRIRCSLLSYGAWTSWARGAPGCLTGLASPAPTLALLRSGFGALLVGAGGVACGDARLALGPAPSVVPGEGCSRLLQAAAAAGPRHRRVRTLVPDDPVTPPTVQFRLSLPVRQRNVGDPSADRRLRRAYRARDVLDQTALSS